MNFSYICFVFVIIVFINNVDCVVQKRSPVILVPGDGGSQMEAKLSKAAVVHYFCQKHTDDYFNIWLNLELLVPVVIDCWIDNVRLIYDNKARKTDNQPGVEIRVPGWGSPEVVEWLDPSKASAGTYFKDIGNMLVGIGYQRNVSLRGAPYDFRKAPNENAQWFVDMQELVENTFALNDGAPVTLVAHSMGGPMCLLFLQRMTGQWKRKYINRLVSLAGAWGGAAKSLKVFAMGDDLGSYALRSSVLREEQISNPSLAWLLPSPVFWKPEEVLITTKSRNYTMAQLPEFFSDLNYMAGWMMREDSLPYSVDFSAPDVEVHCLYGIGVQTVERLEYTKGTGLDGTPTLVTGDGDGTVNFRSLDGCRHWRSNQDYTVRTVQVPGADHMAVLSHATVLNYLHDLLKVESVDENDEIRPHVLVNIAKDRRKNLLYN